MFQDEVPRQRRRFTPEEDDLLRDLVARSPEPVDWNEIGGKLNRTSRQVRERYRNYVNPGLRQEPWTPEEDKLLREKYAELGPRWVQMKQFFGGRSDVNIKNHWSCLVNRWSREEFMRLQTERLFSAQAQVSQTVQPCRPASASVPVRPPEATTAATATATAAADWNWESCDELFLWEWQ